MTAGPPYGGQPPYAGGPGGYGPGGYGPGDPGRFGPPGSSGPGGFGPGGPSGPGGYGGQFGGEPRCYRHPDRPTLVRCVRCDRPICPDCMTTAAVGFQCPECARAGRASVRAPRTAVGAKVAATWGNPLVTYTLVALNLVVYFITSAQAQSLTNQVRSRLFDDWAMQPYSVAANHEYYRIFTSAFLHLSPVHIAMNMFTLVVIGAPVERLLGRWRFAAVYLLAALGGGVAVYLGGSVLGVVAGASGAIYGIFGACLVLGRKLGLNMSWLIGVVALNFVFTFSVSGISALGHVGGFLTGGLAALAIGGLPNYRQRIAPRWQLSGLGAVLLVLAVATAIRTQTFDLPTFYFPPR